MKNKVLPIMLVAALFVGMTALPGETTAVLASSQQTGKWNGTKAVEFVPLYAELGDYTVLEAANEIVPASRGSFEYDKDSGTLTIDAYGKRFSQRNDKGSYVYMKLEGDNVEVTARFVSRLDEIKDGENVRNVKNSRIGIMIRDSLSAGSLRAMTALEGNPNARVEVRNFVNGESVNYNKGLERDKEEAAWKDTFVKEADGTIKNYIYSFPIWLKMVKEGDTIRYYTSYDGESWVLKLGMQHKVTGDTFYVGFAASCGDNITTKYDGPQQVVIDNISIKQ